MKEIKLHSEHSGVAEGIIKAKAEKLEAYRMHLESVANKGGYDELEASINVITDDEITISVDAMVEAKRTDKLQYIFVIGIGGSNLGTIAVYEALRGKLDAFKNNLGAKCVFVDTVSPTLLKSVEEILENEVTSKDEVLINVISKSGGTTETIANFEIVYHMLAEKLGELKDRVVVTTNKGSKFHQAAEAEGISVLTIPELVGGRYSVFSTVGRFPLKMVGIDVDRLIKAAHKIQKDCVSRSQKKNIAMHSAILTHAQLEHGLTMNNNFFFNPELESVGKWYRQLMGESIGKKENIDGDRVNAGITPTVSIGSTDLHSMAQLYLGGPLDKFTNFVYSDQSGIKVEVPGNRLFPNLVEMIDEKSAADLMNAILDGVKKAYEANKLPYMEVQLPEIDEDSIGQYLQFKMMEMMYLAKLMNLNAFNQPSVEDYKKETKAILEQ